MDQTKQNLIDKTILSTPKPCGSSTLNRKEFLQYIDKKYGNRIGSKFEESESDTSSLGIIYDINDKDDIAASGINVEDIKLRLQRQRQLAQDTLEKSRIGLPARYLVPSDTPRYVSKKTYNEISTVSESDLLKSEDSRLRNSITSQNFNPNDVSTPKNSNTNISNLKQYDRASLQDISEIAQKLRNSDVSVKDLCSELKGFSIKSIDRQSAITDVDSGMFTPAELMEDKLLKDEMSWRKQKGIPINFKSISGISDFNDRENYCEKYSVGNFFQGKSDNINNEFFKKSPEKNTPIPLVDLTNTISDRDESQNKIEDDSVISTTEIDKILCEYGLENTQEILNYLENKKVSSKDLPESNSSITSERDVDEYISANKMKYKHIDANSQLSNFQLSSEVPNMKNMSRIVTSTFRDINNSARRPICDDFHASAGALKTRTTSTKVSLSPSCSNSTEKTINSRYLEVNTPDCGHVSTIVNSPTENKENLSDGDRSLTSVRSSSSLDTLPEGKCPIKSNRLELVWGCLKPGRFSKQEFLVMNQLNQKIRMQASVTGSSFRIVKDSHDSEMLNTISFVLRPAETKSFSIMFCPITIGAVSEKINFYPVLGGEVRHAKRQMLAFYGYGGHVNCDIVNVAKDSTGKLWLSLGKIQHQMYVEQKFVIKNSGSLFAFACLDISSKGPFSFTNLKIEPSELIIKPQGEASISVRYSPSKTDLQHFLKSEVIEIGRIKIITGAEVIRGRLRRLHDKLKQQGTPTDPIIERLSKIFSGEKMPSDLKYLKESVSAVKELLQQLSFREITVTVEQDLDSTLVNPIVDLDESSMYHTLRQELSSTQTLDATARRRDDSNCFSVEPNTILFTLPMKREDTIILQSHNSQKMHFIIKTEPNNVLSACPSEGYVDPYELKIVRIHCQQLAPMACNHSGRVLVYVENDVAEVTVKTVFINSK